MQGLQYTLLRFLSLTKFISYVELILLVNANHDELSATSAQQNFAKVLGLPAKFDCTNVSLGLSSLLVTTVCDVNQACNNAKVAYKQMGFTDTKNTVRDD